MPKEKITFATLKNIKKSYAGKVIFQDINMEINKYEPVVIMGENGSGKSTLLRIIAGQISFEGDITFFKNDKIAFVPDRFPKLPFTAESYIRHMGKIQGLPNAQISAYIDEHFTHLNIPRKTKIAKCSKGTIQKINILQALLTTPDLLILDEPFAGLDENSESVIMETLQKLASEGIAIVMACHERGLAQKLTDTIFTIGAKK